MEEVILLLFLGLFILGLVIVMRSDRRGRSSRWSSSLDAQSLQDDSLAAGMFTTGSTDDAPVAHHHDGAYTPAPFEGLVHETTHHAHHDMGSSHHDSGFDSGHHDGGGFDGGGFDGGGHHHE